ncbi:MAG: lytic transglycosylase domain-containing protein [Gemmatimonadetes bacterium]|nr:lytic transglycosylase domain-containing protein [Gemmatimonadota bacterium]
MTGNIKYFTRLVMGLGWGSGGRRSKVAAAGLVVIVVAGSAATYEGDRELTARLASVVALESRAHHVSALFDRVEQEYEEQVAPIERVLLNYRSDDPQLVRRVAVALVREARRTELEPRLLLAVLLVENPWIDPGATSFMGAQGLMQVMPFHRGQWKPCEPRLDDVDANICHGARIFAWNLKATKGDVDKALLRYNGCVRGTNTPDCHQYPNHVYARAGRASVMAWGGGTMGASR